MGMNYSKGQMRACTSEKSFPMMLVGSASTEVRRAQGGPMQIQAVVAKP